MVPAHPGLQKASDTFSRRTIDSPGGHVGVDGSVELLAFIDLATATSLPMSRCTLQASTIESCGFLAENAAGALR
jgi:hypothetical protein